MGQPRKGVPLQNKKKIATPGQKNVARFGLEDKPSIYLPPLHLKLGLGKNLFVKAMDKQRESFAYLRQKFSEKSEAKIKEGISAGPQINPLNTELNPICQ